MGRSLRVLVTQGCRTMIISGTPRLPLPIEQETVLDEGWEFAAHMCTHFRGKLRELRQEAISVLSELQRRWHLVDRQLRTFQSPAIQRVTARSRPYRFDDSSPILCGRHVILLWPCSRPSVWSFSTAASLSSHPAGCP